MMNSSFTIPRKPKFATKTPSHPNPSTAGKVYDDKQPIPRKTTSSSTKRRFVELIQARDDVADGLSYNTEKRLKQSSSSSDDRNVVALPPPPPLPPVYQKIKSGRTLGYPITVTQDGVNRNSQHDAILLNCNDENPEAYLAKFAYNDKVKIKWVHAGYNDFVAVGTITLKKMYAAPPVRQAAADSGLLSQQPLDGDMRDDDRMHDDEDDDAPILKARLNQMLERGDEGENDKDENYNDQEDRDEPLVCYTKTSSVGFLNRKEGGGQSAVSLGTGGNLEGRANYDERDVSNNSLGEGGTTEVNEGGTDWGGDGSDLVSTEEATLQPVTSNVAIKTEDIDTDTEATNQDKDGPLPETVTSSMAIKLDDIDTDTEETYQDKDGTMPEPVTSRICIKTEEEVDTDDEIDTQKLNKKGHTYNLTLAHEAMVLKLFEKLNSCIEEGTLTDDIEEMIKANECLSNAKCPQDIGNIEAGRTLMEALCCLSVDRADTRDLLYEVVCLGGKATDKCYEYVMDQAEWSMPLHHLLVLLLSGYFPTKKSKFFLDELAEGFEEDEEEWYSEIQILRVLHKDIRFGDNLLSCGGVDSTVINNINGLPPLMIGETHEEGGQMEKLLIRFPSTRIICSSCKASKLAWRFSGHHNCCQECLLRCSTCRVWKRRLDHFTEGEAAVCNECVETAKTPLLCSACKIPKNFTNNFSKDQRRKGKAAVCNQCVEIETAKAARKLKKKSNHFKSQTRIGEAAVCKECVETAKTPLKCSACEKLIRKRKGKAAVCVCNECVEMGKTSFLCSACKLKKKSNHFTKSQANKGEAAICKECIESPLKCSACNILKKRYDHFSKRQRMKGEAAVCYVCVGTVKTSLVCSACNILKKRSDHFTKAQRKRGEAAVCNQCVEIETAKTPLVCSVCKVLKDKTDHFSKRQWGKGEAAVCNECVEMGKTSFLCSACKLKKRSSHFTKSQAKKGEAAICKDCVESPLKCSACKVLKKRFNHFTKAQRMKGEAAVCNQCVEIETAKTSLVCSACKVLKKRSDHFSKRQRKRGEAAVCYVCVGTVKTSLVCSACNILKKRSDHFTKAQRKKGEAAVCNECVETAKTSLVCFTCKVLKNRSDHFTKAQRKKGEAAVCNECVETAKTSLARLDVKWISRW